MTEAFSTFAIIAIFCKSFFSFCSPESSTCKGGEASDCFLLRLSGSLLMVARNMIHPTTELRFINETIGYGVFATRFIPRGTITWVRDRLDQTFTPQQILDFGEPYRAILDKYSFRDSRGHSILCWDIARYVNHSCDANCLSAGYDFEIAVVDIDAGEELTDDYGSLNLQTPFNCACSTAECRGQILPEDFLRFTKTWDKRVESVFSLIQRLEQPLWPLVKEKEAIASAIADPLQFRPGIFNSFAAAHKPALQLKAA
jgi:uncharacterized protein